MLSVAWVASLAPAYLGLREAGEHGPKRIYAIYSGLAAIAFVAGVVLIGAGDGGSGWRLEGFAVRDRASWTGFVLVVLAVLIRKAIFPFHSWLPPVFASRSMGPALLLVAPMLGAYGFVRIATPLYPLLMGRPLALMGPIALFTALYAAGLGLVQKRLSRVVAWLATSQSALVLIGLEAGGRAGTVGAIVLWLSAGVALTALGLVSWSLESRYGPLALENPRGLYRRNPFLAWVFLASGLALVAMPGTLGFASNDLLLRAVLETHPYLGLFLFIAVAANGFTVFRTFTCLFHGPAARGVVIDALMRERIALVVPLLLVFAFGMAPRAVVRAGAAAASLIGRIGAPVDGVERTR